MRHVWIFVCLMCAVAVSPAQQVTQGTLRGKDKQGRLIVECPLKRTAVKADVSGMLARVRVVQEFQNTQSEAIEAVYTFPLPHDAAVDDMTMHVGGRVIQGKIKSRDEARALYEAARDRGQMASLLDQERPNIFTQSVANILPGDNVQISIGYVQVLAYEEGNYEFRFPMVVGPRYIPHHVRDGARIAPPVVPKGSRAGHDITIEVAVDAGMPIGNMQSKTHDIDVERRTTNQVLVRLRDEDVIPDKDFILRYETAGQTIQDAVLSHRTARGGFFTLILQPPRRTGVEDVSPKELIFVLDTSGSMSGFPIEKAKEAIRLALDGLHPRDTFNLITFSGDTEILFAEPVAATPENVRMAKLFLESRSGSGGTEMMQAIRAALEPAVGSGRVRVVCFMTDGYVGNDMEIIAEVRKHPEARVFAFGIGSAVNHFLLDGIAFHGRGEVDYVGLNDDGSAAARRFHQRVRDPLMTGITIDWGGLAVADVYPKRIPDLFGARLVMVVGRYAGPARGIVRLRGKVGGSDAERRIALTLPAAEEQHEIVATLWARRRIEDLMAQDYAGAQQGTMRQDLRKQITQLGLDYRLTTQFTSFVAVEERVVTSGGRTQRVEVPVNMPEGVSHRGVFGSGGGGGGSVGVMGGTPGGGPVGASAPRPAQVVTLEQFARLQAPVRAKSPLMVAPLPTPKASPTGKLDPSLVAALRAADQTRKVEVQVLLRDASAATIDRMRQLGFEVLRPPGRDLQVAGRIALGKLAEMAAIDAVRYIVGRSGQN